MSEHDGETGERMGALSGAIFLFGLAILFALDLFWPGIFLLIWLTAAPVVLVEEGWRMGLWILAQMALYLGGLPLLIATDLIWPGIFALFGMSALLAALAPPSRLSRKQAPKAKRKRGLPLPDAVEQPVPDWLAGEAEEFPEDDEIESAPPLHHRRQR